MNDEVYFYSTTTINWLDYNQAGGIAPMFAGDLKEINKKL